MGQERYAPTPRPTGTWTPTVPAPSRTYVGYAGMVHMTSERAQGITEATPEQRPGKPIPAPTEDFEGWLEEVVVHEDPSALLGGLETCRKSPKLAREATALLKQEVAQPSVPADATKPSSRLIILIAANAYLRNPAAAVVVHAICLRTRRRLRAMVGLPELDEHFALMTLSVLIRRTDSFSFDEVIRGFQWLLDEAQRTMEATPSDYPAAALAGLTYTYLSLLDEVLGDEEPIEAPGFDPARGARAAGLSVDFDSSWSGSDAEGTGVWLAQNTWSPAALPFTGLPPPVNPSAATGPSVNLEDTWVDVSPFESREPPSASARHPAEAPADQGVDDDEPDTAVEGPFRLKNESRGAALTRHLIALQAGACGMGQLVLAGQPNASSLTLGTLCLIAGAGAYAARRWALTAVPIALGATAVSLVTGLGYGPLASTSAAQGLAALAGVFCVVAVLAPRRLTATFR